MTPAQTLAPRDAVLSVLRRQRPPRLVYAPNYWQWFAHQRNHRLLPPEAAHCRSQLDLIQHLGLDVFSRNLYCDEQRGWFGGLAEPVWNGVEFHEQLEQDGHDRVITRTYCTRHGTLSERLRYIFTESTLVQEKFAVDDPPTQLDALEDLLQARTWSFDAQRFAREQQRVGPDGIVIAGELFSPLKVLHLLAGPANTTFLIADYKTRIQEMLKPHAAAQLDLVRQIAGAGAPAMMAMDNLDAALHTPAYIEQFSASFYEQAARLCHASGSAFFIHACGRQKAILPLIDSLGVDGLEGVAFPPLGDIQLEHAFQNTRDRFILTGGISAFQTRELRTRQQVFGYVQRLCDRLRLYAHRFILSASCNTSIDAPWETIKLFRDAWQEFRNLS